MPKIHRMSPLPPIMADHQTSKALIFWITPHFQHLFDLYNLVVHIVYPLKIFSLISIDSHLFAISMVKSLGSSF